MTNLSPLHGLSGKRALITGAGSGIGAASAHLLAQRGAAVICADLNLSQARKTAREISAADGKAMECHLDVTSERDWEKAMELARNELEGLDILVQSAGISFAKPVAEMALEEWRRVMAVNLDGVFLGTKHAIGLMRAGKGGSIILLASASGIRPSPGASAYSTSKAAVCMFGKAIAKECLEKGDGIRINTICPGGVKTSMWTTMPFFQDLMKQTGSEDAAFQAIAGPKPGARFAEPEEIAQAVLYLASEEARYITGTDLVIDGGFVL